MSSKVTGKQARDLRQCRQSASATADSFVDAGHGDD